MYPDEPQLAISRVVDAPRRLAFRAFTDPDHLARWWGPSGNTLPRDEIEFDVRPGGFQRWTEVSAAQPDLRVHIHIDLTDVADGDLLEGFMHVTGRLPDGIEPFETSGGCRHCGQRGGVDDLVGRPPSTGEVGGEV